MDLEKILEEWANAEFSKEKLEELKKLYPEIDKLHLSDRITKKHLKKNLTEKKEHTESWLNIENNLIFNSKASSFEQLIFNNWPRLIAALILMIAVFLVYNIWFSLSSYSTGFSKTKTITFPDGSKAYLNAFSEISYDKSIYESKRTINMKGEIFFEVNEGKLFTVFTDQGKISVLGTSFNVKNRSQTLIVGCKTGQVQVESGKDKIVLENGNFVKFNKSKLLFKGKRVKENIDSWRRGKYYFENNKLEEIIDELKIQYGYDININDKQILELKYTGSINKVSIERAVEKICTSLRLEYSINNRNKSVDISLAQ